MFDVNMEYLLEEAGNLGEIPGQLLRDEDVLNRIAASLSETPMPNEIILRIRKARAEINRSAMSMAVLSDSLECILNQYRGSEKDVTEYCEQSPVIWKRGPAGSRQSGRMPDFP